jgi:hypothetical protein
MIRTLTRAGLLIDSWRDQPPQMEPGDMNLPGDAIQSSRLRGMPDGAPSAPRLTSLIALLGAMKWEPR